MKYNNSITNSNEIHETRIRTSWETNKSTNTNVLTSDTRSIRNKITISLHCNKDNSNTFATVRNRMFSTLRPQFPYCTINMTKSTISTTSTRMVGTSIETLTTTLMVTVDGLVASNKYQKGFANAFVHRTW